MILCMFPPSPFNGQNDHIGQYYYCLKIDPSGLACVHVAVHLLAPQDTTLRSCGVILPLAVSAAQYPDIPFLFTHEKQTSYA